MAYSPKIFPTFYNSIENQEIDVTACGLDENTSYDMKCCLNK